MCKRYIISQDSFFILVLGTFYIMLVKALTKYKSKWVMKLIYIKVISNTLLNSDILIVFHAWIGIRISKAQLSKMTQAANTLLFRILADKETKLGCNNQLIRKHKKGYRHVPHRDKPPQIVEKRNERERNRVQAVNQAFLRLRKALPMSKKVSIWPFKKP